MTRPDDRADDVLGDALAEAAGAPRRAIDPAALRRRVDRRQRVRTGGVAALLVALLIAVPVVLLGGDGDEVLLERPATPGVAQPSPAGPPEGAGPTSASEVGARYAVQVTASLEGALAERATVRVVDDPSEQRTVAVGHPVEVIGPAVLLEATDGQPIRLLDPPTPATEPPPGLLQPPTWEAEVRGLVVGVSAPPAVEVVAGGPPGSEGQVVGSDELLPWLPRPLATGITGTRLLDDVGPREVRVPMGDGSLVLRIAFDPLPPASPQPVHPPADAIGLELDVPPPGEVASATARDGTPLWVIHAAGGDGRGGEVSVVDARSPFRQSGLTYLVGWCASSGQLEEPFGGSRFGPDGSLRFGPAGQGLATFATEPAGPGAVRLVEALPGQPPAPPPVWPPPTDADGVPVVPEQERPLGPSCGDGPIGAPGSVQPPDLSALPEVAAADLAAAAGRVRTTARVVVGPDGTGRACAIREVVGCPGDAVPVSLDLPPWVDGTPPAEVPFATSYDVTGALTVEDGVVTAVEVVALTGFDAVDPATGGRFHQERRIVTRVTAVRPEASEDGTCPHVVLDEPCAAAVDLEQLEVLTPAGIRSPHVEVPADGVLPEGWVVVREQITATGAGGEPIEQLPRSAPSIVAAADALPDGTPLDGLVSDDLVVATLRGPELVAVRPLRLAGGP